MSFSHAHLRDVDPNIKPLPQDTYKVRVGKAELVEYPDKSDPTGMSTKERVSLAFVVYDHPEYSGRRIYESLFEGDFGLRALKRIEINTGIPQDEGDTVGSWLEKLVVQQGTLKIPLELVADVDRNGNANPNNVQPDGSPGMKNRVNWTNIAPTD